MNPLWSAADRQSDQKSANQSGFTILEIVVVVALMGLIAAIAGPRIGGGLRGTESKTSIRRFAAALRAARTIAVAQRAQVMVIAELGGNQCEFKIRTAKGQRKQGFGEGIEEASANGEGSVSGVPEIFQKPLELAGEVKFLRFSGIGNMEDSARGVVMFLPQGNNTGGTFVIGREDGPYYEVDIDAITGRVHMSLAE